MPQLTAPMTVQITSADGLRPGAFSIKQGNTSPALVAILRDAIGPVSLTGATVQFHLRRRNAAADSVNALATPDADQVTNPGKVSYQWASLDTAVAGDYFAEFVVTWTVGGAVVTFPTDPDVPYLVIHMPSQLI